MILQILIVVIAFSIQTGFPALLKIGTVSPNLVLVSIVFISFVSSRSRAITAAFLGGFLLDIFSNLPFGISVALFLLIVFLIESAKFFLFARFSLPAILIAVLGATIFSNTFYFLITRILDLFHFKIMSINGRYLFFYVLPKEILYNFITAVIIYFIWILIKYLIEYRGGLK